MSSGIRGSRSARSTRSGRAPRPGTPPLPAGGRPFPAGGRPLSGRPFPAGGLPVPRSARSPPPDRFCGGRPEVAGMCVSNREMPKATAMGGLRSNVVRRRPTLPRSHPRSTIGAKRLSFRVRNGAGRFPLAMAAETLWSFGWVPDRNSGTPQWTRSVTCEASPRPISTGQLHTLLCFHFRPINPVIWLGALPG